MAVNILVICDIYSIFFFGVFFITTVGFTSPHHSLSQGRWGQVESERRAEIVQEIYIFVFRFLFYEYTSLMLGVMGFGGKSDARTIAYQYLQNR